MNSARAIRKTEKSELGQRVWNEESKTKKAPSVRGTCCGPTKLVRGRTREPWLWKRLDEENNSQGKIDWSRETCVRWKSRTGAKASKVWTKKPRPSRKLDEHLRSRWTTRWKKWTSHSKCRIWFFFNSNQARLQLIYRGHHPPYLIWLLKMKMGS
jgi:hypothetical protein